MAYFYSIVLGYSLGCLSPAYLLSLIKKKDLREENTGNLGATNTMLTFGMKWGVFVMVFDVLKAMLAVILCARLFPTARYVGLLGGIASALGHIFPFYLGFKGGKGLATFGGMVLAYSPFTFLILFLIGTALMFLTDFSVALPFSAAVLFPFFVGYIERAALPVLFASVFGLIIIAKHWSNFKKLRAGESERSKEFLKNHVIK